MWSITRWVVLWKLRIGFGVIPHLQRVIISALLLEQFCVPWSRYGPIQSPGVISSNHTSCCSPLVPWQPTHQKLVIFSYSLCKYTNARTLEQGRSKLCLQIHWSMLSEWCQRVENIQCLLRKCPSDIVAEPGDSAGQLSSVGSPVGKVRCGPEVVNTFVKLVHYCSWGSRGNCSKKVVWPGVGAECQQLCPLVKLWELL